MPFCHQCGSKLEEGAQFCPQCGKVQGHPQNAAPSEKNVPDTWWRKPQVWIGALAVVAMVTVAAISISAFVDAQSQESMAEEHEVSPWGGIQAMQRENPVYVNDFIEAEISWGDDVYSETYEKQLDEHGNVVGYSFTENESASDTTFVKMTYDDQGIATSCTCEGDIVWSQTVLERDDEGRPLRVERVKEGADSTFFEFGYANDGQLSQYIIETGDEKEIYTIDERGRISSYWGSYWDDVRDGLSESSYTVSYKEDSDGKVVESTRINPVNINAEMVSYEYDQDGRLAVFKGYYDDAETCVERYSYAMIDDPSPMVELWSHVFNRSNPLSVPTL